MGHGAARVRRYSGHPLEGQQAQYDETVDQRVWGDDRCLEASPRKTDAKHEVTVEGPRVPCSRLLPAVAHAMGSPWIKWGEVGAIAMGGNPGRGWWRTAQEWRGRTVTRLGRRRHRDASMISCRYAGDATRRNWTLEQRGRSL